MTKKWQVLPEITKEFQDKFPEINPVVLRLLYNREIRTQKAIDEFLNPDYGQDIHDPFLLRDMEKAVERIIKAIKKKEKIMVHGDYDADGVTSAALVVTLLEALGGDVDVYLPHREKEGYGLNPKTVKELSKQKIKLIITTDCGISNKNEIKSAKKLGIDVIVTDHHHPPEELPDCLIINPKVVGEKYPFTELAGVGVAFKLAQALLKRLQTAGCRLRPDQSAIGGNLSSVNIIAGFEKWLLDLVAIGTITDCSLLIGENRTLVKYGLIVLNKTRRIGLRKLVKEAGLVDEEADRLLKRMDLDTYNIGYHIGPRLNAAGRINHANQAYDLLMTGSEEEAGKMATGLEKTNKDRQKITEQIVKAVEEQIQGHTEDKVLFGVGGDWSIGIVGLVAGKIVERYNRPTLVITRNEGELAGSGRSIPEFNIIEALEKLKKYLSRFGGHSQACGFTLKEDVDLEGFKAELKKIAEKELNGKDLTPIFPIDAGINFKDINWEMFREMEKFEPFGEGNPYPIFLIEKAMVEEIRTVGKENHHLKIKLSGSVNGSKKRLDAIGFCFAKPTNGNPDWCKIIKSGDLIDIVCEINKNEWNGCQELQLKILDLRKTDLHKS
jgi:single-stranded-DNA-specific exonuclease